MLNKIFTGPPWVLIGKFFNLKERFTKNTNNNKPVVKPKVPTQPMINSIFNFAQASQGDL